MADDRVQISHIDNFDYIPSLLSAIERFDVKIVVPTIDPELKLLAHHKKEIEEETGAILLVADADTIAVCNDKTLTSEFFTQAGVEVPELIDDPLLLDDSSFPVFLKPKSGSSGIGATIVHTREQLAHLHRNTNAPMVQTLATGQEYTVDCFSDLEGRPLSVVPRVRITVRGGEILQGRVERNSKIESDARRILEKIRIPGPSTIQCFADGETVRFIEINPRFGGGAPMSIAAGADSCAKLLQLLNGENLEFDSEFTDGLTFLRFDQSICLDPRGEPVLK